MRFSDLESTYSEVLEFDEWYALQITPFYVLFGVDLCPLVSTLHPPPHPQNLLEEAKKLTDFITGKLTEFTRVFNEKSKLKKDAQFGEFVNRLNCTSLEIDTKIFELMQSHKDQTTQLMRIEKTTCLFNSSKIVNTSKFEVHRNCTSMKKLELVESGNNVELDWDAFDRDLAAMTDAVEQLTSPRSATLNEVKKLKLQVEDLQEKNSELMRQVVILDTMRRDVEGIEDLRQELKQERDRRLEAEQKLRDAEEETKAAKFAYNVAKAVANKMAIDSKEEANENFEVIDRRDSAYDGKPTNAAIDVSRDVTSKDTYFQTSHHNLEDTNPFLKTSHHDTEETNPFLKKSHHDAEDTKPFLKTSHHDAEDTNPFLQTSHHDVGDSFTFLPTSHHDANRFDETSHQGTNPFLVEDTEAATSNAANWNPFSTSSSSNPFLT